MPTVTLYDTSPDGHVRNSGANYNTVRGAASGDDVQDHREYIGCQNTVIDKYYIRRTFLYFDTSPLAGKIITSAQLSIHGNGDTDEDDAGQSDLKLYEGTQGDELTEDDYDAFEDTPLSDDFSNWEYPLADDGWSTINLNADGLAAINKDGVTKFCIRCLGDVNGDTPTGINAAYFNSAEDTEQEQINPESTDGHIRNSGADYDTVHDAATGNQIQDTLTYQGCQNTYYLGNYYLRRDFMEFDTSSLPDDALVYKVTFTIMGNGDTSEGDAGQSDLKLYEGMQHSPLEYGDFDAFGTTELSDDFSNWEYPLPDGITKTIDLNDAGKALINKTGMTKFCIRCMGDVLRAAPSGTYNTAYFHTSESGHTHITVYYVSGVNSKRARLVVTYTEPTGRSGARVARRLLRGAN
jgi:hypothetical protein